MSECRIARCLRLVLDQAGSESSRQGGGLSIGSVANDRTKLEATKADDNSTFVKFGEDRGHQ